MCGYYPEHLSHSQVETYLRCPHSYYLKYVCGIEVPPSFYLTFGKLIHSLVEADGQVQMSEGRKLSGEELLLLYQDGWREMGFPEPGLERRYFQRGENMLLAYARRPRQDIVAVELSFAVDIGVDIPVQGVIDKVYRDGGRLRVADYKTGRPYSPEARRTSMQLTLYALAVYSLYRGWPHRVEFDFLLNGLITPMIRGRDDLDIMRRTFRQVLSSIRQGEFETTCADRRWCLRVCSYRSVCSHSSVRSHVGSP